MELHNYQNLPLHLHYCQHNKERVKKRLSLSEIRKYLDTVIEQAKISEPLLANRLIEFKRWIAEKKDGLLVSKIQVLDLLTEIILNCELWLNMSALSPEDQQIFYEENNITVVEKFWLNHLFPAWFREKDLKSPIWKQKIMAGSFTQQDEKLISALQDEIDYLEGESLWYYLLDLSMATDLVVAGDLKKPLCVQLTSQSEKWLAEKELSWQRTLGYWAISRGLLVSYSPKNLDKRELARVILLDSDTLSDFCYSKRSF